MANVPGEEADPPQMICIPNVTVEAGICTSTAKHWNVCYRDNAFLASIRYFLVVGMITICLSYSLPPVSSREKAHHHLLQL
jgi:hypothetical protein